MKEQLKKQIDNILLQSLITFQCNLSEEKELKHISYTTVTRLEHKYLETVHKIIDKEFDEFADWLRSQIKRLNIVHVKGTCNLCDGYREYGQALTDILDKLDE